MVPLFAFLEDAKAAINELVTGLLMVAGGFLVGYILGGVAAWGVGRWVFKQQENTNLTRLGRPVGGVLLALIVALIVFTGRGKPHGEGGDGRGTPDTDTTPGKNSAEKVDSTQKQPDQNLSKPPAVVPADVILQVTVYAGAGAQGDRCYQLGASQTLVNLAELSKELLAKKSEAKGKAIIAIHYPENPNFVPGNPPGQLHPNVARLVQWATSEGKTEVVLPVSK